MVYGRREAGAARFASVAETTENIAATTPTVQSASMVSATVCCAVPVVRVTTTPVCVKEVSGLGLDAAGIEVTERAYTAAFIHV